ncbi:Trypsin-like serine protease [Gloeomargarita lithophora Alchichica-D10]|uniref:Trypsin-like serine protease n=1 Tax=Gloeomargarita lithophora Alchichica-D10 TaxID=1188229 RepID=A0A1J0AFA5_9CYAN|nr:trypsin-like peptidase domain-containing protein [Gloeomargarita lithophora]APB34618.1 Trypsin-like serine protease [Gloeomargarita lithophora Alchichica-D10]
MALNLLQLRRWYWLAAPLGATAILAGAVVYTSRGVHSQPQPAPAVAPEPVVAPALAAEAPTDWRAQAQLEAEGAVAFAQTATTAADQQVVQGKWRKALALLDKAPQDGRTAQLRRVYQNQLQDEGAPSEDGADDPSGGPRLAAAEANLLPGTRGIFAREITITGTPVPSQTLTPAQIVNRYLPAAVRVEPTRSVVGSGFHIGEGYIITNLHVAQEARAFDRRIFDDRPIPLTVRLYDRTRRPVRVLRIMDGGLAAMAVFNIPNEPFDIALMQIQGDVSDLGVVPLCGKMRTGDEMIAMGTPFGQQNTITKGIISVIHSFEAGHIIQTDTQILGGNSGGPLLNNRGAVVAVNSAGIFGASVQGLKFSVPIVQALERMRVRLVNTDNPGCGGTGTVGRTVYAPGRK